MENQDINTKLSAIDKALAAAKARKASKAESDLSSPSPQVKAPRVAKEPASPEAAAAAKAQREAQRAQLKADREARKAAKAAEKASSGPAHMKKIDRAASKLPELSAPAQLLFNEATTNFSADQVTAIALHLQHFNRVKATERALGQKLSQGMAVRISGGDPKFIGMTGTVNKAQRIRCYVDVPGLKKPVYLFTSDVEIVSTSQASTGTEG